MIENPSPIPAKSAEEIELEKNKKTLSELVALRSAYFQQDGEDSPSRSDNKKNFMEEFLAPYLKNFGMLKKSWSNGDVDRNNRVIADYFAEKFDSLMEKYLPSSSQEKDNFDKFSNKILHTEDPNKIKLESGENLIDQLKENGFNSEDLKKINNKINMTTIINPFSKDNQSIPIELPDGRKLRLDVKQYAEDLVEYNQLQKNTNANTNTKDSSQSQQIELSGILDLYGKHKFNEKFPQEGVKIPLSEEEKKSIEAIQTNANASDKKRGGFAKKFGFEIEGNKPESIKVSLGSESLDANKSREPSSEPIKGILKQQQKESPLNPKPKETVRFGDEKNKEYSPSKPASDVAESRSWAVRIKSERASPIQSSTRSI
jgi:hypothetical protein